MNTQFILFSAAEALFVSDNCNVIEIYTFVFWYIFTCSEGNFD
jgi:hypothetical protein